MKAHNLALAIFVTITAWAAPGKIARVDFRSHLSIRPIQAEWNSPAYAALEDARAIYNETPATTPQHRTEFAVVGKNLKERQEQQKVPKLNNTVVRAPIQPLVISKRDHLSDLIREQQAKVEVETVATKAERLVNEELDRRRENNVNPNMKVLATESGKEIVVAKPVYIVANALNATTDEASSGVTGRSSETPAPTKPSSNKRAKADKSQDEYKLAGAITFSGGAAILDSADVIKIVHIVDGVTMAEGYVNLNEARYDIRVGTLEGELQAVLQGQDGQIRALGTLNVLALSEKHKHQPRIDGLSIFIRPISNAISGTVISAASYGKTIFNLAEAKVKLLDLDREVIRDRVQNVFEDKDIMMPSVAMAVARQTNFWPSLAVVESGVKFQVRLFPVSLVDAFLNLVHDKYQAREAAQEALIWGRVSHAGRPVLGAQVSIVGGEKNKATYFSGFLPDPKREATSERGDFAFSRLTSQEELLQVSLGQKKYWPVMVPLESRHIYYADLETLPTRTLQIKSFDAFSLEPKAALLQAIGTGDEILVSAEGRAEIKADTVRGLTFIESQAGEGYAPIRVSVRGQQTEVNLTQLKSSWLNGLFTDKMGPSAPQPSSTVVGFIEGDDYDVVIGDGSHNRNAQTQVVYFDNNGRAVKRSHGVSGGGFAVYNLPRGLHTLTIVPAQSKKIITQLVYADEFAAHVLRTSIQN